MRIIPEPFQGKRLYVDKAKKIRLKHDINHS